MPAPDLIPPQSLIGREGLVATFLTGLGLGVDQCLRAVYVHSGFATQSRLLQRPSQIRWFDPPPGIVDLYQARALPDLRWTNEYELETCFRRVIAVAHPVFAIGSYAAPTWYIRVQGDPEGYIMPPDTTHAQLRRNVYYRLMQANPRPLPDLRELMRQDTAVQAPTASDEPT